MSKPRKTSALAKAPKPAIAGAGRGGNVPPPAHRFQPGQSGNSAGRPRAGASVREWINQLAEKTQDELRMVLADRLAPASKLAAAAALLEAMERNDLADYEALLGGKLTIEELRQRGIDTAPIKRFKVTTAQVGEDCVETKYELELHDRRHDALEQVVNQTDGTPTKTVHVHQGGAVKQDLGELAEKLAALGWSPATMPLAMREALNRRQSPPNKE